MTDTAMIERELKRLEHYSMRYIEHQKSIGISENSLKTLKKQINGA
jgi:hypothetical protein